MLRLSILLALAALAASTPVDNGVEGEPEIECGPTSIAISFNTRNPFAGHVYVKGLYAQAGCRVDGDTTKRVGAINLPFDSCSVRRTRSLSPKGVFVSTTVIISFHPQFETKVDRAYTVQCFYMEADKTVSTELEVSMLTTRFQSHNVPMPVCRYQILDKSATGPVIKYAIIGSPVYHKWTCDTETVNTFCMRVYGCFVDDGKGDRVQLLDDKGCALDKYLLGNLEYPTDLMAGKESHVFKYADRAALFFQCQIEITVKEPNGQCPKAGTCPEPTKGKRSVDIRARHQPQVAVASADSVGVLDVWTEISALEAEEQGSRSSQDRRAQLLPFHDVSSLNGDNVCLSSIGFGLVIAFTTLLALGTTVSLAIMCSRRQKA